jgi:hypothetical protein
MISFGEEPFLECSSKGDKRFSAFFAKIKKRGGKSIEELYQASKIFEDGSTGLHWKSAKGKEPVNKKETKEFYRLLWIEYFEENPELLEVILKYSGFSDIFGKQGSVCQAEEIYFISEYLKKNIPDGVESIGDIPTNQQGVTHTCYKATK